MKFLPSVREYKSGCTKNAYKMIYKGFSYIKGYWNKMARKYFVRRSWIVKMYVLSVLVVGNGPITSIEIFSKASLGVFVNIIGCLVLTRMSFLS